MDLLNSLTQLIGEVAKFDTLKKIAPIFGVIGVLIRVAESLWIWSNKRGQKARRQELVAELKETSTLLEEMEKLRGSQSEPAAAQQVRRTLEQKRITLTEQIAATLDDRPAIATAAGSASPSRPLWRRVSLIYWPTQGKARLPQVFAWLTFALAGAALIGVLSEGWDSDAAAGVIMCAVFALLARQWAISEEYDTGIPPARSLTKRITLFYRPTRGLGWVAHIVFWYFWLAAIGLPLAAIDEQDPDAALFGIPALSLLLLLVHRWARHFDVPTGGTPSAPSPPTNEKRGLRVLFGLALIAALTLGIWYAIDRELASGDDASAPDPGASAPGADRQAGGGDALIRRPTPTPTPTVATPSVAEPSSSDRGALRAGTDASPSRPPESVLDLDGEWTLSVDGKKYVLRLTNGEGTLESSATLTIEQNMSIGQRPPDVAGTLLVGARPVVLGTNFSPSKYSPDEVLIQRTAQGAMAVWTRDNVNVKTWTSFTVERFEPVHAARPASGPEVLPADLEGNWTFSHFGSRSSAATMVFSGGSGRFVTLAVVDLRARASARRVSDGIQVACGPPTLETSSTGAPGQPSDELKFLPGTPGTFTVLLRGIGPDKQLMWTPMTGTKAR